MIRGWGLEHSEVATAFAFDLLFALLALAVAARSLKVRD
jgi:hypothetical protein